MQEPYLFLNEALLLWLLLQKKLIIFNHQNKNTFLQVSIKIKVVSYWQKLQKARKTEAKIDYVGDVPDSIVQSYKLCL